MLKKFKIKLDKELDLEKIIHRIRILLFSVLATLTADQSVFADRMSQVVVRESSDLDGTSSDDELQNDQTIEKANFLLSAARMLKSSKKNDRRFVNLFKVTKTRVNPSYYRKKTYD